MISAFESSSPQVPHSIPRIKSESSLEGVSVSSDTSTNSSIKPPTPGASLSTRIDLVAGTSGKVTITSADASSSLRKSGSRLCLATRNQPHLDRPVCQIHLKAEDEPPVDAIEHLRRAWETVTRSVLRSILQKSIAIAPSVPICLSSRRRSLRLQHPASPGSTRMSASQLPVDN